MAGFREYPENLYEVLGVAPGASDEEIRKAGRIRQRATHPDLGGNAAEFTRVRLAVEVLTDAQRRAEHDVWLAARLGVVTKPREGVGFRQQQRAPRTRPAPPSPHARSSAAGSSGTPAFDSIPKPQVQAWRMGWHRKQWHEVPEVWPPARPLLRMPDAMGIVSTLPMVFAIIAVIVLHFVRVPALEVPWWPLILPLCALAATWLVFRYRGTVPATTRLLYWCAIAGLALNATGAFGLALIGFFEGDETQVPGLAIHGACSLVGAGFVALAWWGTRGHARRMEMERILCQIANESAPAVDDEQRVWGTPGETAMRHSAPGVNVVQRQFAERIIGPELDALERIPGVRIIHGLHLPGAEDDIATISHAVIAGRRIALIDDQLWKPGNYSLDARGQLLRNGHSYVVSAPEFPHRVQRMVEYFGDSARVRGWIAISPDAVGEFSVDNSRAWENIRLASIESLIREVGEWLAPDGELVDRLLLRDVLDLQVAV